MFMDIDKMRTLFFPEGKNYSINNKEDINKVVSVNAYADMSPRTIKGIKKEKIQDALGNLSNFLYEYFNKEDEMNYENFEKWHSKICDDFLKDIKEKSGIDSIYYGKAQKIVNMSFKYMYCFSDALVEKYSNKFRYCHMALDSYTLKWFKDTVMSDCSNKTLQKGELEKWSNLEKGKEDEEYTYLWIQKKIRDYCNSINVSGFLYEFYIWPEQQLNVCVEKLKKSPFIVGNITCSDKEMIRFCEQVKPYFNPD